jgi:hypothetical protein
MKLSEIRPCDNCGKPIAPMFYVVRFSVAMFDAKAVNATMGLAQMFGGQLGIAEAMTSRPDAVSVAMDKQPDLMTELLICNDCFLMKDLSLPALMERVNKE